MLLVALEETLNLQQLFFEHPRSIGETYFEHQRTAFEIGAILIAAGFACLLHGLVPAAFRDTGSQLVSQVYKRISARQSMRR